MYTNAGVPKARGIQSPENRVAGVSCQHGCWELKCPLAEKFVLFNDLEYIKNSKLNQKII